MKRIAALLLLVCLICTVCGCGDRKRVAILCAYEALPAGQAMCLEDESLSMALAENDAAALQQMESGAADFALVTAGAAVEDTMRQGDDGVWLAAFYILSDDGRLSEWTKNTRVIVVGEQDGYGDVLAQQALTCALYGSVRHAELEDALDALKDGRADVVMGMIAPGDARVEKILDRMKGLTLESVPEGLLNIKLPDENMESYTLTIGGQTAQTYALPGMLVMAEGRNNRATEERVIGAAIDAGLVRGI